MTDKHVPEEFIEQIKQALEHLYDFPFLQRHPLAEIHGHLTDEPSGHHLRRELIQAIETLNPGKSVSVRSGVARLYNLMHLHYIGGMTIQETALELGISLRQAYRDLRRGQESVSAVLWFSRRTTHEQSQLIEQSEDGTIFSLQSEVARLEAETELVNLGHLLQSAGKAVNKLALQNNVHLEIDTPSSPIVVSTNPTLAQQVFINLLSQTVQQSPAGDIHVSVHSSHNQPTIVKIAFTTDHNPAIIQPLIEHFLVQLHWGQTLSYFEEDNQYVLSLTLEDEHPTVLIIDDNEGLVDLLRRYFSGYTFQVLSALTGAEGLEIARNIQPNIIIMDLMMPGMDGWELLQRLRAQPETREIPVIICSVINDPELAYSLGASKFIAKPVNKETILNALKELG
jgi:CheY-like chemotaxis protein